MLTTKQKTLRKYWYATVPMSSLKSGPQPFRLMGEDIVLFEGPDGAPAALADRCCHRTAKLSKGWVDNGELTCGYHGWTYNTAGKVTRVPQLPIEAPTPVYQTPAYRCQERYGYAWVALDEPLTPIIDIPEDGAPGYRRIFQFYDQWNTAPLRLMENSFDNAHFSFVHKGTFGDMNQPKPERYEINETDYGFMAETIVPIVNPPMAYQVTGTTDSMTTRHMRNHWYPPLLPPPRYRIPLGHPPHHHQLRHAHRRRQNPARATALPQRHRSRLPDQQTDRMGRRDHRRGPRSPGIHQPRRRARHPPQDRRPHALGPPRPDHAQAVA